MPPASAPTTSPVGAHQEQAHSSQPISTDGLANHVDGDPRYQFRVETPPNAAPTTPPIAAPSSSPPVAVERRRSPWFIAATTFALGGLVGAGGFGLGRYFVEDGTPATNPATNFTVSETATPDPGAVPIPNAGSVVGAEPVAEVARILGPSVVQVETERGQGSGVVYADGLLLTNHHVIADAEQVRIRTADGRVFETEVLGSDPRNDIAVLSTPGSDLPVASIGSSAALEPGQLTVAIGSPFQLQQTVTAGIVSSVNRPVPNADGGVSAMIQTDAPINPGNSGGALANRSGELVGINASIRTDGSSNTNVGIGFAVPIDTAIKVAERIVDGDSLEQGVLGVSGNAQDSGIGVPIAEVTPGSGADAAGIEADDRILTINGVPVTNIGELTGLVQSHFSGETIELEIERGTASMIVEATLS